MSRLSKLLLLTFALAVPAAYADVSHADEASEPPAATGDIDNFYIGVGVFSDMLNLNVQEVTRWGNFLVRVGQFSDNEGLAANVSWRKPLEGDDGHASGYYVGLFGGQVAGEKLVEETHHRLGAGAEMGYHWVKEYTRAELTLGVGAAEPLEVGKTKLTAEPTIFFSFLWSLGY
jgi:hypothetical protein